MEAMHIHLDPAGGIAGDMFAAAMADAFPDRVEGLLGELAKLGPGCGFAPHGDGILRGRRFVVEAAPAHSPLHSHSHSHAHEPAHAHVRHADIRSRLRAAGLEHEVLHHALALFEVLARAEGEVHGVPPDDVQFHEVGAWDSVADFVAAAYFIAALAPATWSIGPLPLGGGRVKTAHGVLPVPAPATALLMRGLEVLDDGVAGERVTPTGAAIAVHVRSLGGTAPRARGTLAAAGYGFGTRELPGMPNVLRCLVFVASPGARAPTEEQVATLEFEIDDQTGEDLAVALDRIRDAVGVLDVTQFAAFGKKGRVAVHVQVLARIDVVDAVADRCLAETTTLGVRVSRVWRRTALRSQVETAEGVRVKVAQRPGRSLTAKAEMDDLARIPGERDRREEARARAEQQALEAAKPHGHPHRD